MANIFTKFYGILERSAKELQISQSGSTPQGHNERIRNGQSYLYRQNGMESEVIEIRFHKKVWGSRLNAALMETLKRYPYLNTKLIEKDGDFYIVQNPISMTAKMTGKLPVLGGISSDYHLVAVTYFGNSVYVSFHHALCDGRGIKPFVETLIFYYCQNRYNAKYEVKGIRKANDPLFDGETLEPFTHTYTYDESKEFISLSRESYHLPENVKVENKINYRYELTIPHDKFISVCKSNNATPVILIALFMSKAITELYPDWNKTINANIATDMREALDIPNTFKNCVKSMILPYDKEFAKLSLKEQATKYREILNAQRDYDYCRKEANSMLGLYDKLDSLSSYEAKQQIMSFFDGMTLDTYIISYLGQMILGENKKYVDSIHLYNSGTTGLGITVISCGDNFVLNFKQNFRSDKYIKAFCNELDKAVIEYSLSDVIEFVTPEDNLIRRKRKNQTKK